MKITGRRIVSDGAAGHSKDAASVNFDAGGAGGTGVTGDIAAVHGEGTAVLHGNSPGVGIISGAAGQGAGAFFAAVIQGETTSFGDNDDIRVVRRGDRVSGQVNHSIRAAADVFFEFDILQQSDGFAVGGGFYSIIERGISFTAINLGNSLFCGQNLAVFILGQI